MNPEDSIEALRKIVLSAASPEEGLKAAMQRILVSTRHLPSQAASNALVQAWRALEDKLRAEDPGLFSNKNCDPMRVLFTVTEQALANARAQVDQWSDYRKSSQRNKAAEASL